MNTQMLSYGEIYQICYTVYRCNLRCNERILSEMALADELIEHFREYGDEGLLLAEALFNQLAGAGGRNCTHPERIATAEKNMRSVEGGEKYAAVMGAWEAHQSGKIYYNPEVTADLVMWGLEDAHAFDYRNPAFNRMEGETAVHYARRFAYTTMGHERRHNCQPYAQIKAEVEAAHVTSMDDEGYATMPHEMDADNFGIYHSTDPLGMYTYAC